MGWFIGLLVGLALNIVAYLLAPRPKSAKPPEAKDLEAPVAESGKPVNVVFGTMTVKGLNILWYGDRSKREYEVKVDSSGGGKK